MIRNILTKQYLENAVSNGMYSSDISDKTGINSRTIRWYFTKYNLTVPRGRSHSPWNKGLKAEDDPRIEYAAKMANKARRGLPAWNKGLKMPPLSEEHKMKISDKLRGVYVGGKSSNWKGGVSSENELFRKGAAFKEWRTNVFQRDDYTCQECKRRGVELHPHHIKPFAYFKELRFDVDNGITLCKPCHEETDSWGNRQIAIT